jgi:two-component system sensor histidine kinase CpxA
MPRLFFRIFLWFWVGVAVLSATFVLSSALIRSRSAEDERWRQKYRVTVDFRTQHAIDLFDHGGIPAVSKLLGPLEERDPMRNYIFDATNRQVYGSPAPANVLRVLASVDQSQESGPQFFSDERIAAETYTPPSGDRYVFIMTFPQPSVFPPSLVIFLFEDVGRKGIIRFATILGVGAFFCFWLARHIAAPIDKLRLATRRIACGHLDARIDERVTRRKDELGDLGRDFDRMAERIDSLVKAQRQFLADVSHTVRSPLARMNVALGLARQRSGPEVAEHLDRIEREAGRLNKLIGDLLTMAKIDTGVALEQKEIVDLGALLQEVVADGDYEAKSRNCAVVFDPPAGCWIRGAPETLRGAIENVVRNAVQYTKEGTNIEVRVDCHTGLAQSDHRAVIQVRDHGHGVPEDALIDLFVPFYRIHHLGNHNSNGVGLGLAIAERTFRLHGGKVAAANAPNGGLVVTLELPLLDPMHQFAE